MATSFIKSGKIAFGAHANLSLRPGRPRRRYSNDLMEIRDDYSCFRVRPGVGSLETSFGSYFQPRYAMPQIRPVFVIRFAVLLANNCSFLYGARSGGGGTKRDAGRAGSDAPARGLAPNNCSAKAVETRLYRARKQPRDRLGWLLESTAFSHPSSLKIVALSNER